MTDKDAPLNARKKREIEELRLAASRAFANGALRYLDEAERMLTVGAPDGGQIEDLIGRARGALNEAENKHR